jgi:hypothetical protein
MSDDLKILKVHEVNKTNLVRDFLLEMLLTGEWSSRFHNILIEDDQERWSNHISDYTYELGYLKKSNHVDYKYDISNQGRKYLEQQKGETHEQ